MPLVLNFQVIKTVRVPFSFAMSRPDRVVDEPEIRRRLALIHPVLEKVELKPVASLPQTIAGKTRIVVSGDLHGR
jgi:hypothetical protein